MRVTKWDLALGTDHDITGVTDTSDYTLTTVLSIMTPDGYLHPTAFHSQTFSAPELNYDVHDKELLATFEAFKQWQHYLKALDFRSMWSPITGIFKYFSMTKILTHRQAHWSEYLSGFNLVICFRPGKLGTKPDTLTRRWDICLKEGNSDYASVNPQNYCLVFTSEQLASSL